MHTYIYIYIHIHIYIYIYIHPHTHTHIYIYIICYIPELENWLVRICNFSIAIFCVGVLDDVDSWCRELMWRVSSELTFEKLSKKKKIVPGRSVTPSLSLCPLCGLPSTPSSWCVSVWCSVVQRGTAWCSVVQCDAVCCDVLQWVSCTEVDCDDDMAPAHIHTFSFHTHTHTHTRRQTETRTQTHTHTHTGRGLISQFVSFSIFFFPGVDRDYDGW